MTLLELYDNSFAAILKWARKDAGLTQLDLAKATGLKPTAISHFECGRREPSLKNLRLLCKALDWTSDELLDL